MDFDASGSRPAPILLGSRFRQHWAMLDCYLRPLRDGDEKMPGYVSTATGDQLGVSLRAAPPPWTSYLMYHWIPDEGGRGGSSLKSIPNCWDAKAVAAHRNSILLRFLFPKNTATFPDKSEEFFVYQTDLQTLVKLPTCRPHTFMHFNTKKNTGILCRDNGEFVVAHLAVVERRSGRVTAKLCCIFGGKGSWRTTKCVPICRDEDEEKQLTWWETDAVVPFGNVLCWVDYLRGILWCDVLSPDPKVRYARLPVDPYQGRCDPHLGLRGPLATYRTVGVTSNGGVMKFINVPYRGCSDYAQYETCIYGHRTSGQYGAIRSWTLTKEWTWEQDGMMNQEWLLGCTKSRGLSRLQLQCPLVDMRDPETIYFVLAGDQDEEEKQACLITINMKNNTMYEVECDFTSFGSSCMYNHTTSCNIYYHEPFLPLSLDACDVTSSGP